MSGENPAAWGRAGTQEARAAPLRRRWATTWGWRPWVVRVSKAAWRSGSRSAGGVGAEADDAGVALAQEELDQAVPALGPAGAVVAADPQWLLASHGFPL
jgi:hypothetical protein